MNQKNIFLLFLLFIAIDTRSQIAQIWINNFCCFDSIAPHSFSYPLYSDFTGDTIVVSYFEDQFLNFKKIDASTGIDIQTSTFSSDTIESAFYFGGGTISISNHLITSALKYDGVTGQGKLFLSSVDDNFNPEWSKVILTTQGKISNSVSDLSENNFYSAISTDSLKVFKTDLNGNQIWSRAIEKPDSIPDKRISLFITSTNEVVLLSWKSDSTGSFSQLRLIKLNSSAGTILADTVFVNTIGEYHLIRQYGDKLRIGFEHFPDQFISFIEIDLLNFNENHFFESAILGDFALKKFAVDTLNGNYYWIKNTDLYGFSATDTMIFHKTIFPGTSEIYDGGEISFDESGNLLISISFHNSNFTDLISYRIDKNNGNTLDSIIYNDSRNTDENYLNQFYIDGKYFVVFANNFDDLNILQEETQLGIIKYSLPPVSVFENEKDKFRIFPNPFDSQLTVSFSESKLNANFIIYDLQGRELKKGVIVDDNKINLEQLENGLYLIKVNDSSGICFTERVIKK